MYIMTLDGWKRLGGEFSWSPIKRDQRFTDEDGKTYYRNPSFSYYSKFKDCADFYVKANEELRACYFARTGIWKSVEELGLSTW